MQLTFPMILTLLRIALIPFLVLFFYAPYAWAGLATAAVFILAAVTDWLDGHMARRMGLMSSFGAFLDPVADKLMVATALVLLVQKNPQILFTLSAAIIIGREIAISALREWMAEMGKSGQIKVSSLGKVKTIFQMTAISFMLYERDLLGVPLEATGLILLYMAAALTLWSMWVYLRAAWPAIIEAQETSPGGPDNDTPQDD